MYGVEYRFWVLVGQWAARRWLSLVDPFEQTVASGEHGDQELFDRCILADDDLGYLLLDLGERLPEGFSSRHFFR